MKKIYIYTPLILVFSFLLVSSSAYAVGSGFNSATPVSPGTVQAQAADALVGQSWHTYKLEAPSEGKGYSIENFQAFEDDGKPYDGSKGIDIVIYTEQNTDTGEAIRNRFFTRGAPSDYPYEAPTVYESGKMFYVRSSEDKTSDNWYLSINYRGGSNYSITYKFDLILVDYSDLDQGDAGSVFSKALQASSGDFKGALVGSPNGKDVKDVYSLQLKKDDALEIKITPSETKTISFKLYNEDKEPIKSDSYYSSSYKSVSVGSPAKTTYIAKQDGLIYIEVAPSSEGYYETSNAGLTTYDLKLTIKGKAELVEGDLGSTDAGSSFSDAKSISLGTYADCCSLNPNGVVPDEIDYYKFTASANKKITIKATPPNTGTIGIALFDKDKVNVQDRYGEGFSYSSNKGAVAKMEYVPKTDGEFYLAVVAEKAYGSDSDEIPYSLELSVGDVTVVCQERDKRCSTDFSGIEVCSDGKWIVSEQCGTDSRCNPSESSYGTPLCSAAKTCVEGNRKCLTDRIAVCQGGYWSTVQQCEFGCTGLTCNTPSGAPASGFDLGGSLLTIIIIVVVIIIIIGGVVGFLVSQGKLKI